VANVFSARTAIVGSGPRRLTSGVWWLLWPALVGTAVGAAVATNFQIAFLLTVGVIGCLAIALPASIWVVAAVVASLTFKGLVTLGVLPSVATFLDLPLAWGALAAALLAARGRPPNSRSAKHLRWLGALSLAVALAWSFNRSEVVRPVLYLLLLGEPFAIVAALWIDPPSVRLRRLLTKTAVVLVAVQVPLMLWQAGKYGLGDGVQGTLYGAAAGAHVISAVAALSAGWLLASRRGRHGLSSVAAIIALLVLPVLADAKQVLFALPAAAIVGGLRGGRVNLAVQATLVAGALGLLFFTNPLANPAVYNLQQARHGHNGKIETAKLVWHQLETEPASIAFGKGPAETVSRTAFMTTDLFLHKDSSLRVLHLKPAVIPVEAQLGTVRAGDTGTSFNSGVSSLLGVFGDLGVFGALVFTGLVVSLFSSLRRVSSPESIAATSGWAMYVLLGLVYDWWEQPPFTVFLAVLTGLAVTSAATSRGERG